MYIFSGSSKIANVILIILIALLFYGGIQYVQQYAITTEFIIITIVILFSFCIYIIYLRSMKIIIRDNKIIYKTLFEKQTLEISSIQAVTLDYSYSKVESVFPYIHICGENEKIEIPMMVFESEIEQLMEVLKNFQKQ